MTELFNGYFLNKKVFVTGHTGFKGSWLTYWLTLMGADVTGYSLEPPTQPSLFGILKLKNKIHHITGDVRDTEFLEKSIRDFQPEVIFHLAAQPLVRLSYQQPKLTFETNIMGTVNVLEAARKIESLRVIVNVTSDKCYDNKEWVHGYRENEAMGGYDPYSSSKGCSELVTSAYRNSFFNPADYGKTHQVALATARAGNVIGGGDWAEGRLIPDIFRALESNRPVIIRNPLATRPWQHVVEPLSGYLWLAAKLSLDHKMYSESWNLGPNYQDELSVEELVKQAILCWGSGKYEVNTEETVYEAKYLKLDISKAWHYLNWKPTYKAVEAINKTILWYKENYQKKNTDMEEFTYHQLNEYIQLARQLNHEWAAGKDTRHSTEENSLC